MFELRMTLYDHYPDFTENLYIDLKSMLRQCEIRTIRLIAFWMANKIEKKDYQIFRQQTNLFTSDKYLVISNGEAVLDMLLPYIPADDSKDVLYSDWSGRYKRMCEIERCCVELIKKANITIISKTPEVFWEYYEPYMGKGYHVFNEIILSGMRYLPESFSNQIIRYLSSDLDKNIFDKTSGSEDELWCVKEIIKKQGYQCDQETILGLEKSICRYISPRAVELYKWRIENNKDKKHENVYWSFWGDLQWELLHCLPKERLCKETDSLLQVLDRRFEKIQTCYYRGSSHMGSVQSPISGKDIGVKRWLQIITNNKLPDTRHSEWSEEKGCFVESSYSMYVSNFGNVVGRDPEKMIKLMIEHKGVVLTEFINSLFSGVAFSENIKKIPVEILERMFQEFPCDMESERAAYFCIIVENSGNINWSMDVINQLKEIALNHKNPELEEVKNSKKAILKSCKTLHEHALNCTRGHAISAISTLLQEDIKLLEQFKDTIEKLIKDKNPIIRFASLDALWSSFYIDRTWVEEKIMFLYEADTRMAGYYGSKDMLLKLYPKYGERVIKIVGQCMASADEDLIELGSHAVCEFYIRYQEFETVIFDFSTKSRAQVKAILNMAVQYLGVYDYREIAKSIILKYKNSDVDVEFPLSSIFYNKCIDSVHDKEFLRELMKSKVSRRIIYAFTNFWEEQAVSVVEYADIIIALCENVLQMEENKLKGQWGIENEISKLIMALYDETANSERKADAQIAARCLDLWDIMFEKQLGSVRQISYNLMER